jgi:hypothetical protein
VNYKQNSSFFSFFYHFFSFFPFSFFSLHLTYLLNHCFLDSTRKWPM